MSPRAGLDTRTLVLAAAELADEHGMEGVTLALLAAVGRAFPVPL